MKKRCKDHLGNVYSSVNEMCEFWKIPSSIYHKRYKSGYSLEQILTTPVGGLKQCFNNNKKCVDFEGTEFSSIKEMCDYYKVNDNVYRNRIRRGYTLKEALMGKPKQKTLKELAADYNVNYEVVKSRVKRGMSVKDALQKPLSSGRFQSSRVIFQNVLYPSKTALYEAYGVNSAVVYDRMHNQGLTWEDAILGNNIIKHNAKHVNYNGVEFASLKELCDSYNVPYRRVVSRLYNGWVLDDALTIPRNMRLGEYRVSECLKRLNVTFYHDCSLKTIFEDFNVDVDWNVFLSELKNKLDISGIRWSESKIEKLRPDFVLYTGNNDEIIGVIEFDGEQHHNFVEYFFKTIEEFLRRSNADFVKQDLWEYLNIPMLRIRYDQVNAIDDMVIDLLNNPKRYLVNHNTYLSEDEYWEPLNETKKLLDIAFAV